MQPKNKKSSGRLPGWQRQSASRAAARLRNSLSSIKGLRNARSLPGPRLLIGLFLCLLEQAVDDKTQPMLYAMKRYVNRSMRITLTVGVPLLPISSPFDCTLNIHEGTPAPQVYAARALPFARFCVRGRASHKLVAQQDGRVVVGTCICFDYQGNILMSNAEELNARTSEEGGLDRNDWRNLGMIMVPSPPPLPPPRSPFLEPSVERGKNTSAAMPYVSHACAHKRASNVKSLIYSGVADCRWRERAKAGKKTLAHAAKLIISAGRACPPPVAKGGRCMSGRCGEADSDVPWKLPCCCCSLQR